jgi:hypothetical protein
MLFSSMFALATNSFFSLSTESDFDRPHFFILARSWIYSRRPYKDVGHIVLDVPIQKPKEDPLVNRLP